MGVRIDCRCEMVDCSDLVDRRYVRIVVVRLIVSV